MNPPKPPDDLFKMDVEKYRRLQSDPKALSQFFDDLVGAVAAPFKAMIPPTGFNPIREKVAPAPVIDVDAMFPVERVADDLPKKPTPVDVPSPKASEETRSAPRGYTPPPIPPKSSVVDHEVDQPIKRPVRLVDQSVVQKAPELTHPEVSTVKQSEVAPPRSEAVNPSESVRTADAASPAPPSEVSATVKDLAAAEKRRTEREEKLSGLMNKPKGDIL